MAIGAVSAADNTTQDNTIMTANDQSNTLNESCNVDDFSLDANEKTGPDSANEENSLDRTIDNPIEGDGHGKNHKEPFNDNKYYIFRGDCWTVYNNFESSASITSESLADLTVTGTFRTENDFIGLYWYSQDPIQHPYISYGNHSNYSNVILEFDYEMTGCRDFGNNIITVAANSGETYYLDMSRFIENEHVTLDFNNLTLLPGNSYVDKEGHAITVSEETKLNVENLKFIMFSIVPSNFVEDNTKYTIMENVNFTCRISNITVANGEICNEHPALEPHQYRLCEGYDDIHTLNPFRLCKEMRKLGYVEWVDLYIGASYFYEKSGIAGDIITDIDFNNARTEKMVLNKNMPLNTAFRAWLDCYSRELKNNDVENLIVSVSMENLQCPQDWRQMDSNGNFAVTGWSPSTFLFSPCNDDAVSYMQNVSESCLDIVANNGLQPILQMGETWWWWDETPYFYDNSTKTKYLTEHGSALPEYNYVWSGEYDKNVTAWLNNQLVQYSDALREVVKSDRYDNGTYMALFFLPSVTDADTIPQMIIDVNYIKDAYSPSKLDILQIEDYDWVIFESPHHIEAYTIGQELGFSEDDLHYFGGFVQNPEDADRYWPLIEKAMDDAIEKNFSEVFVWAGSQVRRDNKILGCDEDKIFNGLTPTTVTAPDFVSIDEHFTIKIDTQKWICGYFNVYDYNNDEKGELLVSNTLTNGSSSVTISSSVAGLNKFYLELDYSGGEYHLIQEVHVIENSQNITADIPLEIETGSNGNITFNAPKNSSAFLYISIDENAPNLYLVENSGFTTAIPDLPDGYHRISLKYNDENLGEAYSNTFTVNVGIKTIVESSDAIDYGENLVVTLKDIKGNVLKGKTILIELDGLNHTSTTDDNGQTTLTIDLLPGNYSAAISFNGDKCYLSSFVSKNITVNKIATSLTSNNVNVVYGDDANLVITLKDNKGNAISGQNIVISLNNQNYNKQTDSNGQIKLSVSLPVKEYTAKITFAGSDIYKSSTIAANVVVTKATAKITAKAKTFKAKTKTKKYTITLKDNKGKAIKKVSVTLKVKGKTYKATTNNKGKATFKIKKLSKKGRFKATVKFAGNINYKSASKKVKISIK